MTKKSVTLTPEEWLMVLESLENRRRHKFDALRKRIEGQLSN